MFFAMEPQSSSVYVLIHPKGLGSSKPCIHAREVALRDENAVF